MVPFNSSSNSENCSPQSSNCVTWQGPNLPCINLCKGDSVSDVVYKLAVELCEIKDATDLTDLDLNCILDLCQNTQDPPLTTAAVLQVIIDGLCCSVNGLTSVTEGLTNKTDNLYEEPTLVLPECLQYVDPSTGLPVTTLVLSEYAVKTATALCDLRNTVVNQGAQITNLDNRVTVLESDPGYTPPTVTPHCTYGTVVAGVPTQMDVVLSNLDERVCDVVTALGEITDITTAASSQCNLLGSQPALSQVGNMSTIAGWNNTISNMAQSMQNLWITVCDMRAVIYDLKECCDTADCSAFILAYTANANIARTEVTLIFNSGTVIPSGFSNCPLLSTVSITDGVGNTYTDTLDLVAASSLPGGVTYNVATAFLNSGLPYTVTVTGCLVKGSTSCSKSVVATIAVPTTTTTTTTSTTTTSTTTTTTTAAPCTCYNWEVSPTALNLADATGNTNSALDGYVFVDLADCTTSVVSTYGFNTSTPNQILGCSCDVPYAYYYKDNNIVPAAGGTIVLTGACILP